MNDKSAKSKCPICGAPVELKRGVPLALFVDMPDGASRPVCRVCSQCSAPIYWLALRLAGLSAAVMAGMSLNQ
jgi:endogenous inhibitor of DNA gyrase (YacG/DUF329 family)